MENHRQRLFAFIIQNECHKQFSSLKLFFRTFVLFVFNIICKAFFTTKRILRKKVENEICWPWTVQYSLTIFLSYSRTSTLYIYHAICQLDNTAKIIHMVIDEHLWSLYQKIVYEIKSYCIFVISKVRKRLNIRCYLNKNLQPSLFKVHYQRMNTELHNKITISFK